MPADSDWLACPRCRTLIYRKRYVRNLSVCPQCGDHSRLTAPDRLDQLLDEGSQIALTEPSTPEDPLGFTDLRPYRERLRGARESTGLGEAVICARGTIEGKPIVAAAMDFRFMGGSLGIAVGERITQAAEAALRHRVPLLLVTSSGGARMQEGTLALLQMAKTSAALAELDKSGILTIAVICDPTYAGVAASYASLADVIIAEPGARMGFTGPRVIEQTIGQRLPESFQTAEFLLDHGLLDDVVPRAGLRTAIARLLTTETAQADSPTTTDPVIRDPEEIARREPWEAVQLARKSERPTTIDYVTRLMEWFIELHGDRMSGDCPAIVGGIGQLEGRSVVVVGHQKGHNTAELSARDFGMPMPAGYRKAARLMRLAAKLGIPVITLVDTPGAHPGMEAEESGQAIAIAENLRLMSQLPVPIVTVITGEGGSGGALALSVADRVLCLATSVYSVISPEGCAAILWRDRGKAEEAAKALRMDAAEQLCLGIVDGVVPEPAEGVHENPSLAARLLGDALTVTLDELAAQPTAELLRARHKRYREIGTRTAGVHGYE